MVAPDEVDRLAERAELPVRQDDAAAGMSPRVRRRHPGRDGSSELRSTSRELWIVKSSGGTRAPLCAPRAVRMASREVVAVAGSARTNRCAGADGQHPEARRICSRTGVHDVFAGLDATAREECTLR
jgi:hypothetical protein